MSIMSIKAKPARQTSVRTTVTLDADVLRRATDFSRKRGVSFREGLNELVRVGLVTQERPVAEKPYEFKMFSMQLKPGLNYDKVSELLEWAEGPDYR